MLKKQVADVMPQKGQALVYVLFLRALHAPHVYVGSTTTPLRTRLQGHKSRPPTYLARALAQDRWGLSWDGVQVAVLEIVQQKFMSAREEYWTQELQAKYPEGYNHQLVGGHPGRNKRNFGGMFRSWMRCHQ